MKPTLALLALAALAVPAAAGGCVPTTTQAEVTIDLSAAGGSTYYETGDVVCMLLGFVTNHQLGCGDMAFFLYEESNGMAGLQRGDEIVDDTCQGQIQPDTIVF